ncbi:T9SS type A sorting domain-containing protein [Adhaeribacter sp. BT258]|uniref:T9SS type A sorting domain-containing protein n=1 Tax=Adhaeribacter terrigena TaxID=2793070 RepID=A0ABS1C2A9_9BACT|nr:T9SS type A sorting domain-containing protein [Adhaeribacter terrigena]MBK0403534.1 T9SS type A sorting domain-containing protein [Adhaeribacter terrigena]
MKKLFTLAIAMAFAATSFAQTPNSSMENWQTKAGVGMSGPYTYQIPQKWELGFLSGLLTTIGVKPNVDKSTTKNSGSFALQLSSNSDSMGVDLMTTFNMGPNAQPQGFTGFFQTSGVVTDPNDFGQTFVFMTKWNGTKTDTIGFGMAELDSSPNSFKPFTANIQYTSNVTPDSAIIYFMYFPQEANTHVLIDDLSFIYLLGTKENTAFPELTFYPNPVSGNQQATLKFTAPKAEKATLTIRDMVGKEVKTMPLNTLQAGANTIAINTDELKTGLYLATLESASGSQTFRFVKR